MNLYARIEHGITFTLSKRETDFLFGCDCVAVFRLDPLINYYTATSRFCIVRRTKNAQVTVGLFG